MNIVYKDDVLFVNLKGEVNVENILSMKNRLFSILDSYEVGSVVINVSDVFSFNKTLFNSFLKEYHKKYNKNITFKI